MTMNGLYLLNKVMSFLIKNDNINVNGHKSSILSGAVKTYEFALFQPLNKILNDYLKLIDK